MSKHFEEAGAGLLGFEEDHPSTRSQKLRSQLGNTRLRAAAGVLAVAALLYTFFPLSHASYDPAKIPLPLNATDRASLSALTTPDLHHRKAFNNAECDFLFGELYAESTRAKEFWKARGGITQELVEQAQPLSNARVILKDGQVCLDCRISASLLKLLSLSALRPPLQ